MSKPNERSCRILLGKKVHSPLWSLFFLAKKLFSDFLKKFWNVFFNEIDCKKFSNVFCNEFSSKKFFNSLKLTIENFRLLKIFLLLNSLKKISKTFLQSISLKTIRKFFSANYSISLKKHFEIFSENPKKTFLKQPKKKGVTRGGMHRFFPAKCYTTFCWVLMFSYDTAHFGHQAIRNDLENMEKNIRKKSFLRFSFIISIQGICFICWSRHFFS